MELEKIRNLSAEEMKIQAAQAGEQLFRIRFQKTLGNTEGLKKLGGLKLDLARIKTVARERELLVAGESYTFQSHVAPLTSTRTARKQKKASR